MRENKARLDETLHNFNIDATIVNIIRGPSVTRYELELASGVKLAKLTNLSEDIALALGATGGAHLRHPGPDLHRRDRGSQ